MRCPAAVPHLLPVAGLLLASLLASASPARAQTWAETGDAGDLVATAQVTAGSGLFTAITGELSQQGDVDLYCLQLLAVPPMNQPLAGIACSTNSDPSLFLFDAGGVGVDANLTCAGGMKLVAATGSMAPGLYYLAVAHNARLPQSANGPIWSAAYTGHFAPDGSGAGAPLTGWIGTSLFVPPYPYQLTLYSNWVGYCEQATPTASVSWGALKATYGD
jgi:hypothetical protein